MNLIDEQHIPGLEIGEDGGQVPRPGDYRSRSGAKTDAELPGDDLRQRGLAETRGPIEQHMIHGLAAALGRIDEHLQIIADLGLADEFLEAPRPGRSVPRIFGGSVGGDYPVIHPPCSPQPHFGAREFGEAVADQILERRPFT